MTRARAVTSATAELHHALGHDPTRLLSDLAAAEDVVQEAFVRVWIQAGRFDPGRARFSTWMYRIVVNLCVDHRRRMRFVPLPDDFDQVDESAGADELLETAEQAASLMAALRDLPPHHRLAMSLVYDEVLPQPKPPMFLGRR